MNLRPNLRPMNLRALLLISCLFACVTIARAMSPVDYHAELRELKTTYETALSTGNLAPLEPLFDAGSSGVTVDNQNFRTFAELQAIYAKFHAEFPGVVYEVKLDAVPSLLEGNLAVAHGTATEHVKTSSGEFNYTSTWTVVLRRTDTGWKLVRSQITMDPFNNPVVRFFEQKAKFTYGLTGLAVGLLAGLLLSRLFRRRQ